jgi:transposase
MGFSFTGRFIEKLLRACLKSLSLEEARKETRPREVDLYDVFCGVLYILKSGCQWRMLPSDFPKWNNVYAYFRIWTAKEERGPSLLEEILKKIGWRGPCKQWSER